MKIGIIGAGNMGGAIARGLASNGDVDSSSITVASPNRKGELDALKNEFAELNVSIDNKDAINNADIIFIAVKPWLLGEVIEEIGLLYKSQTIVSVVAGVSCNEIAKMLGVDSPKIIRLIPNTAISVGESMTFIATNDEAKEVSQFINALFSKMGKSMIIEERNMVGATALASCGIAYALRYIRAASEGGVELGFYADSAKEIVMQTIKGAVALLEHTGNNPEVEIDKVTTPGGITIKGLNAMERNGFSNSVIEGLKSSTK
ncbi:MAG: pyrroline-5-carboxylate reductase [Muribaculaceae bacterium]|nr:pyrroline-5-carboxylate reductase [Muribaculaceae bacterium]